MPNMLTIKNAKPLAQRMTAALFSSQSSVFILSVVSYFLYMYVHGILSYGKPWPHKHIHVLGWSDIYHQVPLAGSS
jgi:hypothetical protein